MEREVENEAEVSSFMSQKMLMLFTETGNQGWEVNLGGKNGKSNLYPLKEGKEGKRVKDCEKEKSWKCGEKQESSTFQKWKEEGITREERLDKGVTACTEAE